jgi:hypothetical protein
MRWAKSESDVGGIGRFLSEATPPGTLPGDWELRSLPWELGSFSVSMRLPKISHAEMHRRSSRKLFLPMSTRRIKRHSPAPEIAHVPVDNLPLSDLLSSLRSTSRQVAQSADVSTSHDIRCHRPGPYSFMRIA